MPVRELCRAVWEQNRSLLLSVLGLALLSLGLLIYQTQVVSARLVDLQMKQTDLQKLLRQHDADQADSGVLLTEAERLDAELRRFQEMVPGTEDFSVFLGDLFQWSKSSGLEIDQISYVPKVDSGTGLLHYGLSFSVTGGYRQLKRFIYQLENAPRLLSIDKIALSGRPRPEEGKQQVQLQIQLTTYFREGGS